MGLMDAVLCESVHGGAIILIVVVLDDVDPVAESVFAGDQAGAAVGEMRGHVEGDVRGCVG